MQNNILNKEYHTAGSSGSADAAPRMTKNKQCAAPRMTESGHFTSTCHPCESGDLIRFPVKRGMTEKCGRSTPSLSLRGGLANEAISGRLPRPIGLAMTGYKKGGLVMTGECGRSMVEMLGVLAVMGVLSVAGIAGYNSAMNKHRANELLNEASKRATVVAAQAMQGRETFSINEFPNNEALKFSTEVTHDKTNGQFTLTISGVSEAICQQMKNAMGPIIRKFEPAACADDATVKLTFNDDMSTDSVAANPAIDPGEEETPDCGAHGEAQGSACVCDLGWTGTVCDEETTPDCSGHGTWSGAKCTCTTGYYGEDCAETEQTACDGNDDCAQGYFCNYNANVSCSSGPTASKAGTCAKISANRGGKKNGYIWSRTFMDWYSAQNFCDAQDKDLVTVESLKCYKNGTSTQFAKDIAPTDGFCCQANGTTCNNDQWTAGGETRANVFSAEIVALRETIGTEHSYLTQNMTNNSCYAFIVYLSNGVVSNYSRSSYAYALCE